MSGSILISWRSFWRSTASSVCDTNDEDEHECRSSIRLIDKEAIDPFCRLNTVDLSNGNCSKKLSAPACSKNYEINDRLRDLNSNLTKQSELVATSIHKQQIQQRHEDMKLTRTTKNNRTKSQYHRNRAHHSSICRLFNVIKLSIQLLSILTTVPTYLVSLQHQEPHRQSHQLDFHHPLGLVDLSKALITSPPVNRYQMNSVPSDERSANRINEHHPQQQQQQQQQQPLTGAKNWTGNFNDGRVVAAAQPQQQRPIQLEPIQRSSRFNTNQHNLLAPTDLWTSDQQVPRSGRPTYLSDFVANQGQKLMKNFANSTIAELVAQPVKPLLLRPHQQVNLASIPNTKYLPTMGRLYSFLFPNNTQILQAGSPVLADQQQLHSPLKAKNKTIANSPFGAKQVLSRTREPFYTAPSNNHNVYLGAQTLVTPAMKHIVDKGPSIRQRHLPQPDHRQQVINLSAPYESRARASIAPNKQLNRAQSSDRSYSIDNQLVTEDGHDTHRLRRGYRPNLIQPDGSSSHVLYEQQLADPVNGNEYQPAHNIYQPPGELVEPGGEGTGNFEAINMQQHEAAQAADEVAGEPDQRKQEIIYAENGNQVVEMQHEADLPEHMAQYMQEPPGQLGGGYGARRIVDKEAQNLDVQANSEFSSDRHFKPPASMSEIPGEQVEQAVPLGEDQQNEPEQPVGGREAAVEAIYKQQGSSAANQQVSDDEEEALGQVPGQNSDEIMSNKQQEQQQRQVNLAEDELSNQTQENASVFNQEVAGRPDFRYSFANESTAPTISNDDSFLNLRLPSQYEATIRLPPEGYYDDYFKPASTNLAFQSHNSNSPINNPESLPEFALNANEPSNNLAHQQTFELEDESLIGTRNATNESPRQQEQNSMEFIKQYYLNQRPLKQNEATLDQNVEFIAGGNRKNSTTGSIKSDESGGKLEFEVPQMSSLQLNGGVRGTTENSSSRTREQNQATIRGNSSTGVYEKFATASGHNLNKPSAVQSNEDNIELIIANTNNSSRDPLSNEKHINYISENGHNNTRQAAKPARNTFVNKEMNEFPPPIEDLRGDQSTPSPSLHADSGDDEGDSPVGQQQVQAPNTPENQLRRPASAKSQQPGEVSNENDSLNQEQAVADEEDQLRRVSTVNSGDNLMPAFGRYNKRGAGEHQSTAMRTSSSDKMNKQVARSVSKQVRPIKPPQQLLRAADEKNTKRIKPNNNHNYNQATQTDQSSRHRRERQLQKGSAGSASRHRRPPVTQVHFNPKDLIAIPPTSAPSNMSPIESIANLPSKVKKLRDNQPDKNELMNELLTALDRVKVAIYNLQPLTARMNAIYRKSVTSNTRDIIMDHHKGTYAKRYPPGDYDNVYDRMRPQQIQDRQQRSSSSSSQTRSARSMQTLPARGRSGPDMMTSSESAASAVYLPAPQEIIESYKRQENERQRSLSTYATDGLNMSESKLVATGIGRRLGDGRVRGTLSLSTSNEQLRYESDNDNEAKFHFGPLETATNHSLEASDTTARSAAPSFVPPNQLLDDSPSPLFGYRITIYQSPVDDSDGDDDVAASEEVNNEQFSYQIEGDGSSAPSLSSAKRSGDEEDDSEDTMATSESSVTESHLALGDPASPVSMTKSLANFNKTRGADQLAAESKESMEKSEDKKKKGSSEHEKKSKSDSKEKEDKKKEKSKKSYSKKAKGEEGKKKKKEYKKIKHEKGVVSQEKKVMHRDKRIKAHDRGAAKEKALKERTQIEFFEREQIVDDEFEKGKKSLVKAGWQSGHDQKKGYKDHSGEQISMGGSHYVSHSPKDVDIEKKHGVASEMSSGKKSNKFMKKDMEAKGKKFKGWREKGYKIITETEFIDRGSLHDSAYKKHDKGHAKHNKYKAHKSMSEGHHGSMHEEHKKSHKKEEKKAKMHEKKAMKSKSAEHESDKSKDKKNQKKSIKDKEKMSEDDHDDKMMMPNNVNEVAATVAQPKSTSKSEPEESGADSSDETIEESVQKLRKHRRSSQPMLMSATSSTFRPALMAPQTHNLSNGGGSISTPVRYHHDDSATLMRLLNANHDEDTVRFVRSDERPSNSTGSHNHQMHLANETTLLAANRTTRPLIQPNLAHYLPAVNNSSRVQSNYSLTPDLLNSSRRSEQVQFVNQKRHTPVTMQPRLMPTHFNGTSAASNATILDIVDNLTGRQINKSKIATYELEGQAGFGTNDTAISLNGTSVSPIGMTNKLDNSKASARYVAGSAQLAGFTNNSSSTSSMRQQQVHQQHKTIPGNHQPAATGSPNASAAAMRQNVKSGLQRLNDNVDGSLLLSLIQRATSTMQQQQVRPETKPIEQSPFGDTAVFQRPYLGTQVNNMYMPHFGSSQQQQQQQQLINQLAPARQHHQAPLGQPASGPGGLLTVAQAEIAARLLHLVQSASSRAAPGVNNRLEEPQQSGSDLLELSNPQLASAFRQRRHHGTFAQQPNGYIQQPATPSQAPQLTMLGSPRSQMDFNGAVGDPSRPFGADQLLDYELYPLSKTSQSLFAD